MNSYSLSRPFFVLAPMDDVTDTVFRQIIYKCAKPDLFFTEFTNVDGLQSPGRPKLISKLRFTESEQPLIAQLWGKDPTNFRKTAEQIANGNLAKELGLPEGVNFAGIDLNMGCPQKSEVSSGTCSALINNRPLAKAIINATKEGLGGKLPVSVKTRLGWDEIDLTWLEFLLEQDLAMLTVHGRTRKEMSKVPTHWDSIGKVREARDKISPMTLIVGNGDVLSREQGQALINQYKLDGIMIGRGIFNDPFVFAEHSPWPNTSRQERIDLYRTHVELFKKTWGSEQPAYTLNKFCKVYISGFNGAKEMRERLMRVNTITDLISMLERISTNET